VRGSRLGPSQYNPFVAFTNEESPFTRTRHMGSQVYARACRERGDRVIGMLCLETLGCYSQEIGSQRLSLGGLLLPRRGNFPALVGNLNSRPLLHLCRRTSEGGQKRSGLCTLSLAAEKTCSRAFPRSVRNRSFSMVALSICTANMVEFVRCLFTLL
jgi:hypothetical protein